ncbi:MAG: phospho-sugar mutase [Clostridiales bacterium]|nr:phospho-sugar mutase [Clostridiales bacterium]
MEYLEKYKLWCENEVFDEKFRKELKKLSPEEIEDAFYTELTFGTAGIRGVIGVGSNRMNEYIVGKVTQGYANFLNNKYVDPSVVIAYDSRHMSPEFSLRAAKVLSANKIKVYLFDEIASTPELSFAVRYLKTSGGIVMTASHNPSNYNGYKAYHHEGYQLLEGDADLITQEINKLDFKNVLCDDKMENVYYIGQDIFEKYYNTILNLIDDKNDKKLKIVYTPLNGAGARPVVEVLKRAGFNNLYTVAEQMIPDSNFTTVPYPNPENEVVFKMANELGLEKNADILIATDPDSDRVGVLVLHQNEYVKINGNQMGALLADYLLKDGIENQAIITTIVSSHLIDSIAKKYNAKIYKTLTGFKYIGELITSFDSDKDHFVLGFEESYGYLTSDHARDKDAVDTSLIISEMANAYKEEGKTLIDQLDDIYKSNGYFKEDMLSFTFEGSKGHQIMQDLIARFRKMDSFDFNGENFSEKIDYMYDDTNLPQSNVLKFIYPDQSWFAIRPSGTEPKLKIYISVYTENKKEINEKIANLKHLLSQFLEDIK